MYRKNIVVLFGGQSSEHDVSCVSAVTVIKNIDVDLYNVILIGITKEGKWLLVNNIDDIESGKWRDSEISAIISPDATKKAIIIFENNSTRTENIDIVFPVLHGLYGEDGTVQGLLELAQTPYVGCGVLASSVSMDKLYTKVIVDTLNIRQAKYVAVYEEDLTNMVEVISNIEKNLSYPVFVKPSNAGSSKGVSKANNAEELLNSLNEAIKHDRKILVEETIIGREIECGVLGAKDKLKASVVGEVLPAGDASFYDYDAKYNNQESKTVIDPDLPLDVKEEIRNNAISIFKAVDGFGLARVDFFVENGTNDIVFNEINTLPGFTSISMYPMLWNACGLNIKELVSKLIDLAHIR